MEEQIVNTQRQNTIIELLTELNPDCIGSVGSPSTTTDIVIDILEAAEHTSVRGQLVYMVIPQDACQLVILGQVTQVKTQNQWHEDATYRGMIKRSGRIPHLSNDADVRSAQITVQACFEIRGRDGKEEVAEGLLGNSPATGTPVYRVTNEVIAALLADYQQLVMLGHVYGTQVRMPFSLKHFGRGANGAGEAYHIGVFGRTGSGKSGMAAYMLIGYARHRDMGLLVLDPQAQFSTNTELPFNLHGTLKTMGRPVIVRHLSTEVRLPSRSSLFCQILGMKKVRFYRWLGVGGAPHIDYAADEVARIIDQLLRKASVKLDQAPDDLLVNVLQTLSTDEAALKRIYVSKDSADRVKSVLQDLLQNRDELSKLRDTCWQPALDLFLLRDSIGRARAPLEQIVQVLTQPAVDGVRPVIFLDISGKGSVFADDEEMIALLLNQTARALQHEGDKVFREGGKLNCLVVLDEAHRYACTRSAEATTEVQELTRNFVDAVRTTRKYGLGYMFITQTLASLHQDILQQLRLYAFGYGLNMGTEAARLQQMVGDRSALDLYNSFVDPAGSRIRQYPFMMTGPSSPFSFTGAPHFLHVFTDIKEFIAANPWIQERRAGPDYRDGKQQPPRPLEVEL